MLVSKVVTDNGDKADWSKVARGDGKERSRPTEGVLSAARWGLDGVVGDRAYNEY